MIKNLILAAALVLTPSILLADEASHRKAAEELLSLTNAADMMRAGFNSSLEPLLNQMKQRGAPEQAVLEIRQALKSWMETEIKWEEIQPKVVDVYTKEFTEGELRDLLAFYNTPTGKRTLEKLPIVTQKSMQIGQEYAQSKGESLNAKIKSIVEKHKPAAAPAPATK